MTNAGGSSFVGIVTWQPQLTWMPQKYCLTHFKHQNCYPSIAFNVPQVGGSTVMLMSFSCLAAIAE